MEMKLEKRGEDLERKGEKLDKKGEEIDREVEELDKKSDAGDIMGEELERKRGEIKKKREELKKERGQLKKDREKLKKDREERQSVKLYIYDLVQSGSGGIPAIWHTGVVVYGKEFTFNDTDGVNFQEEPGKPREIQDYGQTKISEEDFFEFLTTRSEYTAENYSKWSRNCVTFCSEVLIYLTKLDVPKHIKEQAKNVGIVASTALLGSGMVAAGAIKVIKVITKK